MGFGHWIMANFWPVTIASLIMLAGAHFAITWLLRNSAVKAGASPEKKAEQRD